MNHDQALQVLSRIRFEFLGDDRLAPLNPDDDLYACGFDSLSLFNYLLLVEERFEFKIPDELFNYRSLSTVADLVRIVAQHSRVAVS